MPLQGYSNPVSPKGLASLVEPTPHHISAEAIQVYFRAGEDVVRPYLPEGLEPVDGGLAYAYVADMVKVSEHDRDQVFENPERTQYREGLVGFYCQHKGVRGRFSAFLWVSQDWSAVFGHIMGWGKKIGQISMTKVHTFNPGIGDIAPGKKLRGIVSRHGLRVMDIGIELERREPDDGVPSYGHRTFLYRYFPSTGPDVPEVRQLLLLQLQGARTVDVWSGKGFVTFGDSDNEELLPLQPKEVVGAYYFKRGWTTDNKTELLIDYSRR